MSYQRLHLDFETKSIADLAAVGTDNYAKHPSTDALCAGFAFDDKPVEILTPMDFVFAPFKDYIHKGGALYAYNAPFEIAIWNNVMVQKYDWPVLKPEQCTCVMAMSYAMALPGKLELAAPAAGIDHRKDMAGHRVMLQLTSPRNISDSGEITWWDDQEKLEKLYAYCMQDVEVERQLTKRLLHLSPYEKRVWLMDFNINNRGVYLDKKAIETALRVVEEEQKLLNEKIRDVTGGAVATATAVGQLTDFLRWQGVKDVVGVAKNDIVELLSRSDLPKSCKSALEIRQEAGKSSTAKLKKMLTSVSSDGRLKNMFQYSGAATRRFSGRNVQLHNLPRPLLKQKQINDVFDILLKSKDPRKEISMLYGPVLQTISDCIRGFLCAPEGKEIASADFSNIEGRVLAWLAGEDWKLEAFRKYDAGLLPDIYVQGYARSFNISLESVDDFKRQIGKVQELALGFQGADGAFQQMAKGYGVKLPSENVKNIVARWREAHPNIKSFWYALEYAAMQAILNPGQSFFAGADGRKIGYKVNGSFLWCRLPSGGVLCYPYPKIEPILKPWGQHVDSITYMAWDSETKKWLRISTYGGSLAENVTQATARDLLVDAMLRIESPKTPVVLHVHDEINCEVDVGTVNIKDFEKLMSELPSWAKGLPIAAKGSLRKRYGK